MTDEQAFHEALEGLRRLGEKFGSQGFPLNKIWTSVDLPEEQKQKTIRRLFRRAAIKAVGNAVSPDDVGDPGELMEEVTLGENLENAANLPSLKLLDIAEDRNTNCFSILASMTVKEYLNLVSPAYRGQGGIQGQRGPLKTSTAIRIRKRLTSDLAGGAVLPPLVVGIVLNQGSLKSVANFTTESLLDIVETVPDSSISIIDGMQRTTAMLELSDSPGVGSGKMRLEFWITADTNSLIYRMLVLNTGQVPWDLKRQIEVIHRSLLSELKAEVKNIDVHYKDDDRRRRRGGQFAAAKLVEMFMVFGTRKEQVNIPEKLADEFSRLDFVDATAERSFTREFFKILQLLVNLDLAFARKDALEDGTGATPRFNGGGDLFGSISACVGFMAAVSIALFGRPGSDNPATKRDSEFGRILDGGRSLLEKLNKLSSGDLAYFLDFSTLNERFGTLKAGPRIAETEREFFLKGFQVLVDEAFNVEKLTPCWRAY